MDRRRDGVKVYRVVQEVCGDQLVCQSDSKTPKSKVKMRKRTPWSIDFMKHVVIANLGGRYMRTFPLPRVVFSVCGWCL